LRSLIWQSIASFRACDLVKLRVDDICSGTNIRRRATIVQKKTARPVQFEITGQSRSSLEEWLPTLRATGSRYLFPSRLHASPHISTRQYARLVHRWVESIGLESALYGTHSMRRTKAAQIYRKTGNLRAVQLLIGHTKLESTVRYPGVEVDDALNMPSRSSFNRRPPGPPASRRWSLTHHKRADQKRPLGRVTRWSSARIERRGGWDGEGTLTPTPPSASRECRGGSAVRLRSPSVAVSTLAAQCTDPQSPRRLSTKRQGGAGVSVDESGIELAS
jgi:hypothetical protein